MSSDMDRDTFKQILIFLPQNILKFDLICVCGLYNVMKGHCHIVCLLGVPCVVNRISCCLQKALKSCDSQNRCTGIVYTDPQLKGQLEHLSSHTEINFILEANVQNNSYCLNKVFICGHILEEHSKVIIYDSNELANSLLSIEDNVLQEDFLQFLLQSSKMLQDKTLDTVYPTEKSSVSFSLLQWVAVRFFGKFSLFSLNSIVRFSVEKCMKISSVGVQLHRRCSHLNAIIRDIKNNRRITLRCGNLISAIVVDAMLGVFITILIWHYVDLNQLLDVVMAHTSFVVNELQRLIYWLMGIPAGLKLNKPLNNALGHFFLYHIYLWKAYMAIVKPVFIFVMESFTLIGIFGVTFLLTLFNDLVSLATVHIYCFYGYAARLYALQAVALTSSWRLFWGKKWNPLRQRVDSYSYDIHQLFIGTLMFTVLLFLLPTILLYYLVFTTLRLSVLTVQGIVSKTVHMLNVLPAFVVILRFFGSSYVKGSVQFQVLSNQKPDPVVLLMKVIDVSYSSVVQMTAPKNDDKEQNLSWKHLVSSLLWGRIIYPL